MVELNQIKTPDEEVGPLKVIHDHALGVTTLAENVDAWSIVNGAKNGISSRAVAASLYETPNPTRNQIEKAPTAGPALRREGGPQGRRNQGWSGR